MKKILALVLTLLLTACGGGGGSTGSSGNSSGSNPGNTPGEDPIVPDPNDPNIIEELTAAEQLFGQGNGTGATPTNALFRTDDLGFPYYSFGAWGNVYDIKMNDGTYQYYGGLVDIGYFTFIQNAENAGMNSWNKYPDVSVADSTFKGPAIMNHQVIYSANGGSTTFYYYPDYGSLQVSFGHDINDYIINFVMHNPENNLTLTSETVSGNSIWKLNDERDKIRVQYSQFTHEENEPFWHTRIYQGYGIKQ
jgi:hypothetical protein